MVRRVMEAEGARGNATIVFKEYEENIDKRNMSLPALFSNTYKKLNTLHHKCLLFTKRKVNNHNIPKEKLDNHNFRIFDYSFKNF